MSQRQPGQPGGQGAGHEAGDPAGQHMHPPRMSTPRIVAVLALALTIALLVGASGIVARMHAAKRLASDTQAAAVPQVTAFTPKQGAPVREIVLPGNIQAYRDAPIYARTNGYLQRWLVDIGGHARKGQLLAVIDSPEIDQQAQQGRADLGTALSNLQLAEATSARYQDLLKSDSVSRQDAENVAADAQARRTMLRSAEANVKRLEDLQSFERITAPFDGVITARNTDTGQLINAGNAGGAGSTGPGSAGGRELFHIAATDRLRVFVNVPQMYSRDARPSATADLTLTQFPGRRFSGKLVRNAGAIDPATRTLLVEIDVPNPKGELLPGSYAQVHLKLSAGPPTVMLPVSALIFRTEGLQAAVLDGDRVHLAPITLGRDFGTQVEVATGLTPGQRVIDSPPDGLVDGERVHAGQVQPPAGAPQPASR